MDAVTIVPEPANEPVHTYAPGIARARLAAGPPRGAARGGRRADPDHRRPPPDGRRRALRRRRAAPARLGARHLRERHRRRRGRRRRRREGRRARLGRPALRRARRGVPARRRPARRAVARHAQRRHDAGPVQVGAAGGDRRRLRADRLPAVQRALRPPGDRRAAALGARRVEPDGLAPARRLRHRHHPVQLHGHRREPADGARAHGQHGGLEADPHPAGRRAPHDAAARGRGPARRRDQHGDRRRARRLPRRPDRPRPGRPALHRLVGDLQDPLAHRRRQPRPLPQLPADRRRDRRQGLRRRPPVGRPGAADHRARPRRVRVPGPEVLGRLPRLRPAQHLAGRAARGAGRRHRARCATATSRT